MLYMAVEEEMITVYCFRCNKKHMGPEGLKFKCSVCGHDKFCWQSKEEFLAKFGGKTVWRGNRWVHIDRETGKETEVLEEE